MIIKPKRSIYTVVYLQVSTSDLAMASCRIHIALSKPIKTPPLNTTNSLSPARATYLSCSHLDKSKESGYRMAWSDWDDAVLSITLFYLCCFISLAILRYSEQLISKQHMKELLIFIFLRFLLKEKSFGTHTVTIWAKVDSDLGMYNKTKQFHSY